MRVDYMTKKGELTFAKECKHLRYLRDEISTNGNKKHAKHKAKTCLNQKHNQVHREEEIFSTV